MPVKMGGEEKVAHAWQAGALQILCTMSSSSRKYQGLLPFMRVKFLLGIPCKPNWVNNSFEAGARGPSSTSYQKL